MNSAKPALRKAAIAIFEAAVKAKIAEQELFLKDISTRPSLRENMETPPNSNSSPPEKSVGRMRTARRRKKKFAVRRRLFPTKTRARCDDPRRRIISGGFRP